MTRNISFPIRLKILVTLLIAITAVLSTITFTMANLFHEDKRAYINDLTSVMAIGTAEECRTLLASYRDRLESYGRVMNDPDIDPVRKAQLLESFFQDFEELVALTIYGDEETLVSSAFDGNMLEHAGIDEETLAAYRRDHPLPPTALADGRVHVESSTLVPALPTLTLTHEEIDSGRRFVVSATIHLGDLLELSARSRLFRTYIVDSDGILLAHPEPARVVARERASLPDDVALLRRGDSASLIRTLDIDGVPTVVGHAGAEIGDVIAAAEIPASAVYLASRTLLRNLLIVSLGLLVAAAVFSAVGSRRITRPVERLVAATRAIGRGEFDIQVAVSSRDEIGTLAASFNQMAVELHERDDALRRTQEQLVQSEKLAALGELGAAIAHEVKNPLAGILGCAQLSIRKPDDKASTERNLTLIEKETKRCQRIVENLLKFARPEKPILEHLDANQVVSDTAAIVRHQLEMNAVHLTCELSEQLPEIHGNANQLQQVLMNLMINAQQAMADKGGNVTISTRRMEDRVEIAVADDGPGMPEEVRRRVFDPFFTTKPRGKGTGLGLSVSFGIVRDHRGKITVESAEGAGTTFRIALPAAEAAKGSRDAGAAGGEAAA